MLDLALLTSVVVVAITTGLLFVVGRRPLAGRRLRTLAILGLAVGAGLGSVASASPGPLAIGVAIAIVTVVEPGRWYAVGATFFATLLVSSAAYAAYLAQATLLLANDPLSLAVGPVLLALEIGAMVLIVGSAFEMIDALCSRSESAP